MKNDAEIIESLILGGVIGAALGQLISAKNSTVLGAIAGAAILASYKASENAKKMNIPVLVEENDVLYEVNKDGSKKWIKDLPQSHKKISKKFILK